MQVPTYLHYVQHTWYTDPTYLRSTRLTYLKLLTPAGQHQPVPPYRAIPYERASRIVPRSLSRAAARPGCSHIHLPGLDRPPRWRVLIDTDLPCVRAISHPFYLLPAATLVPILHRHNPLRDRVTYRLTLPRLPRSRPAPRLPGRTRDEARPRPLLRPPRRLPPWPTSGSSPRTRSSAARASSTDYPPPRRDYGGPRASTSSTRPASS